MSREQFRTEFPKWLATVLFGITAFFSIRLVNGIDKNNETTAAIQTDVAVIKQQTVENSNSSEKQSREIAEVKQSVNSLDKRVTVMESEAVTFRWPRPRHRAEPGTP